ncbi:hypothetical protein PCO31111_04869 [Pandoraea communis]|uniref:Uncharacterized protein n=1 Tax=Pandoraea communis TaxID=2508297 RepID=A0A5E4YXN2_9BURK|nr:hypothetical protein [Pandoraea communis]VVE53157.1 hypothetical protein PCO31111_04869 [Pandoraea communis]
MKTSEPLRIVGLAWYLEQDYDLLKSLFVDGDRLPATFDKWEKKAEELRKSRLAQGEVVVKAHINPRAFPAWCAAHGKNVDASGRMAYANSVAAEYARNLQKNR